MTPAIAAVVAMYGAFLVVGWLASRKVRDGSAADLIVAGRSMPLWMAALTMAATWVDGGYLPGTTEGAYKSSILLGMSLTTAILLSAVAMATVLPLKVQSVQALWFFSSDLVFVLLFPQLLSALFDRKANRTGSIVAFVVSLVPRVGGGEPLLSVPALVTYPETMPFRIVAAVAGLVLLPVVSRLSARWDEARPLRDPVAGAS